MRGKGTKLEGTKLGEGEGSRLGNIRSNDTRYGVIRLTSTSRSNDVSNKRRVEVMTPHRCLSFKN